LPGHNNRSRLSCCCRANVNKHAIQVTKQASGSVKIDPLMVAFNANALMAMSYWSARPSVMWI